MDWLDEDLKSKISKFIIGRYGREPRDGEIEDLAVNLTGLTETLLKFEWRVAYGR